MSTAAGSARDEGYLQWAPGPDNVPAIRMQAPGMPALQLASA